MEQSRFRKTKTWCNVALHSEIRILIDSARNEDGNLMLAENVWKGCRQCWSSLNSRKANLANDVRIAETENSFHLIVGDAFFNSNDVAIIFRPLTKMKKC